MVKLENNRYVIDLPEHHLYQDCNPDAGGAPFASEAVAQAWQDNYLAEAAAAQTARDAELAAQAPARLDAHKTQKIAAIRAKFDGLVAGLKADAAPYEVDTWPTQHVEHSAWVANPATPTPYTSQLAASRGIPHATLMAKIGVKVAGLATIQGKQQALEDAVKAATTEAEVDAVAI